MATKRLQYLVDENGRKRAVLLSLKDYRGMVRRLEELEDALVLDEAKRAVTEFRDHRDIRKELKAEGRL